MTILIYLTVLAGYLNIYKLSKEKEQILGEVERNRSLLYTVRLTYFSFFDRQLDLPSSCTLHEQRLLHK